MKIFKELKKLGYIHYSATTIEELDDLPLNSAERISEQALAFRWFREKHKLYHTINMFGDWDKPQYSYLVSGRTMNNPAHMWHFEDKDSHEEAELACLIKLIEIVKNKKDMKQNETLEEAKYNAYKEYWNENHTQEVKSNFLTAFKLGAKWQAERMYSEEEVEDIAWSAWYESQFQKPENRDEEGFIKWFEQFKKK